MRTRWESSWPRASDKEAGAILTRTEINRIIDEHIMDERDRYILKRKLLDGVHYPQIVEEMGDVLSLSSVQKRASAAQKAIAAYLQQ